MSCNAEKAFGLWTGLLQPRLWFFCLIFLPSILWAVMVTLLRFSVAFWTKVSLVWSEFNVSVWAAFSWLWVPLQLPFSVWRRRLTFPRMTRASPCPWRYQRSSPAPRHRYSVFIADTSYWTLVHIQNLFLSQGTYFIWCFLCVIAPVAFLWPESYFY